MGMYGTLTAATEFDRARVRAGTPIEDLFGAGPTVNLEKFWQAMHFLFTGNKGRIDDSPLSKVVLGGARLGPDLGYGPARYLTPAEVKAIAHALSETSFESIWTRFGPRLMTRLEVYPDVWDDEDEPGLRDLFSGYFDAIVDCDATAAASGKGMLFAIT